MFKSTKYNFLLIIITILITVNVVQNIINRESFGGYIRRQSQVTYRRKHHQGWGESARSG